MIRFSSCDFCGRDELHFFQQVVLPHTYVNIDADLSISGLWFALGALAEDINRLWSCLLISVCVCVRLLLSRICCGSPNVRNGCTPR